MGYTSTEYELVSVFARDRRAQSEAERGVRGGRRGWTFLCFLTSSRAQLKGSDLLILIRTNLQRQYEKRKGASLRLARVGSGSGSCA
jgi:hypothetical protein